MFTETYGKTPLAYLTILRVEEMAHLLRETDLTIEAAARTVGWASRSRANEAFKECVGMTPSSLPYGDAKLAGPLFLPGSVIAPLAMRV